MGILAGRQGRKSAQLVPRASTSVSSPLRLKIVLVACFSLTQFQDQRALGEGEQWCVPLTWASWVPLPLVPSPARQELGPFVTRKKMISSIREAAATDVSMRLARLLVGKRASVIGCVLGRAAGHWNVDFRFLAIRLIRKIESLQKMTACLISLTSGLSSYEE